jgi:hypothetical protein
MVDRFLVWLATGIVAAGLSAAMLAVAGVATPDTGNVLDGRTPRGACAG